MVGENEVLSQRWFGQNLPTANGSQGTHLCTMGVAQPPSKKPEEGRERGGARDEKFLSGTKQPGYRCCEWEYISRQREWRLKDEREYTKTHSSIYYILSVWANRGGQGRCKGGEGPKQLITSTMDQTCVRT